MASVVETAPLCNRWTFQRWRTVGCPDGPQDQVPLVEGDAVFDEFDHAGFVARSRTPFPSWKVRVSMSEMHAGPTSERLRSSVEIHESFPPGKPSKSSKSVRTAEARSSEAYASP